MLPTSQMTDDREMSVTNLSGFYKDCVRRMRVKETEVVRRGRRKRKKREEWKNKEEEKEKSA